MKRKRTFEEWVVQQAFHECKQNAGELAADYVMEKYSLFKRGWSHPTAPFSFYYEAATAGLLGEGLCNEVHRTQVECQTEALVLFAFLI